MRKVIFGFCIALVFYSVAVTGYGVAQRNWFQTVNRSPEFMQNEVTDISSRGAFKLAREGRVFNEKALLFFDDPSKVNGLAIGYWLYPIELQSIATIVDLDKTQPYQPDVVLGKILQSPKRPKTIIFVGSPKTLEANIEQLKGYKNEVVTKDETGTVFNILESL